MLNVRRKTAVALSTAAGFILAALPAAAQGLQIIPQNCIDTGAGGKPVGLECILDTGISVGRVFFGLAGSFALLMFVIGGFYYVTSAGRDDYIKKGKEYIKNAVIGLVIILTAAYFIEYGLQALKPTCSGRTYLDSKGATACCETGKDLVSKTDATGTTTTTCVSSSANDACNAAHAGWSCVDVTDRADKGSACEHGLCLGANANKPNVLCCPSAGQ